MKRFPLPLRAGAPAAALLLCAGLIVIAAGMPGASPADDPALPSDNCTVIMACAAATVDGSTITTHTADCGTCDWTWRKVPAADHKAGETRKLYVISQMRTWPPKEGLKGDMIKKDF
jgi:hypothetical protein